ncbi:RNA polymerase sigma-70 factor [Sphingobacterium sp. UT-1RO-CII-1]|uniref:RNA polymerase sigma factor n=1 Tax=Sphingobacterium sp. UT-1RO-CII-1 TaxID=2995225 RepID=UPI00227A238D|nr:RNA polymerase sigma-70 factor [Sphingobacterium sp. UT-1RO-CII-1]MCY4780236.1 RNA polymerase sigma-70 factor [Sphingobacterium sp. UT-1RO-CII-1]
MYSLKHDKQFFKQLAEGSSEAFEQLFEVYWMHVYTVVEQLVKTKQQAEDISQEVFIKLWNKKEELYDIQNIEAYLYTIARNSTLDHLRKKILVTENLEQMIQYFADNNLDPIKKLEYKELEVFINTAINNLPDKVKEVFILSRIDGLSHEQIAAQLNISVTSSKTYIVRALKSLRQSIAKNTKIELLILASILLEQILSETR